MRQLPISAFGLRQNARTGAGVKRGTYQYIVFPKSASRGAQKWPRSFSDIENQVNSLLASTPGIEPA